MFDGRFDLDESTRERLRDLRRSRSRLLQNPLSVVGFMMILIVILTAVFAPVLAPYPEDAGDTLRFEQANEPPSLEHPMGTDTEGRDILSRVIFGARISLLMGLVVLGIAISIGVPLGLIAGYLGGWVNILVMRTTDIFLAIPPILLALAVAAVLTANLWNAMIAIAFGWWTWRVSYRGRSSRSKRKNSWKQANHLAQAGSGSHSKRSFPISWPP